MLGRPTLISSAPAAIRCRPSRAFAPQIAYTSASIDGSEIHESKNDSRSVKEDTPEEQEWFMKQQDSKDFTLGW
ncbi:hypothetical protein ZYGR_0E01220 [Zygosaccharomyces rouxii]|uniref:ZYRO0B02684p n=2 Tax=Zygosaccharomyces rouxii TaxID=4956 RepID=C5DQS8_ZYGRC|nr:uncharacterized protein ZYRO0B02684g [Zygosaccharomyces rouxii]KAH9200311.1 hypothetical protein LQ764DRAFT_234788 [Zygosaccharomyces rouxii]GAV47107.1 hypothetical protein ZYGR_0E01220 [Zygosaccharomyces rouxii]CAR26139.1 ZYRO0B02684p [Zygosaccharomyces rouxii]